MKSNAERVAAAERAMLPFLGAARSAG